MKLFLVAKLAITFAPSYRTKEYCFTVFNNVCNCHPLSLSLSAFLPLTPLFSVLCEVYLCCFIKWRTPHFLYYKEWINHNIIYLLVDEHLACFQYFIRTWFAMNILLIIFWYAFVRVYLHYMLRSEITF